MNAREFFYKDYYQHQVTVKSKVVQFNLKKPVSKVAFGEIKDKNKPVIADANKKLRDFMLKPQDYQCLKLSNAQGQELTGFTLITTYPGLLIGTGYTHQSDNEGEFKMGFYFDYTTGLPCIPGSSVKGLLRSVFPQMGSQLYNIPERLTDNGRSKTEYIARLAGWEHDTPEDKKRKVHQLELALFEGADLKTSTAEKGNQYRKLYDRVLFFNAYISKAPGNKIFETDAITPHGEDPLKNPVPLNFLKIRPGVGFTFQFQLQDIDELGLKKDKLEEMFVKILKYTGAGAKTNTGYGQFE